MKRTLTFLLLTFLCLTSLSLSHSARPDKFSPRLWRVYQSAQADDEFLVWVYFTDKGRHASAKLAAIRQSLSPKSAQRRLTARTPEHLVDMADVPVEAGYVQTIRPHVQRVRHESKWLNAVSLEATRRQIDLIRSLDFVKAIDLVARYRVSEPELIDAPIELRHADLDQPLAALPFNYGPSLGQLQQINVPAVHQLGNYGQGVIIGVFDAGFNNFGHEAFKQMKIIARHDFVNGDDNVSDGRDMGQFGQHGTAVLSVMGGFAEGKLIGPAFAAEFILAKTENHPTSETPREEDNWIAALEWAEGMGVDIISSSVGYLDFDAPFQGYTWQDMNGDTATITRAAVMAVGRGIVIVNSAGNNGNNPTHNTLIAPADGDGVIAAGAVNLDGIRAGFSSVGPTVDGRIKPDVVALGVGVLAAANVDPRGYQPVNGTSFAAPLTAGVAALIRSAHPDWSPMQVLDALRRTASQTNQPDNLLGWGIVNALNAVEFDAP
jgi:hypothetical protein